MPHTNSADEHDALLGALYQGALEPTPWQSFLPRLLTTLITVMVAGPWLLARLIEFTRRITDTFALVLT